MEDKKPSQVLNFLFIGSRHHAKDKKLLAELNIKYILNCTPKRTEDPESGCPNFYEKDKMFVYKRISLFDNKGEDILPYMEEAIRFIGEGKHYGSVLVHCHRGISRRASFVIGYLIRHNELTCAVMSGDCATQHLVSPAAASFRCTGRARQRPAGATSYSSSSSGGGTQPNGGGRSRQLQFEEAVHPGDLRRLRAHRPAAKRHGQNNGEAQ